MVVLGGIGGTHPPKQMPNQYLYDSYALSTGLRMIPQETISSPWKELKVESNCFLVSI